RTAMGKYLDILARAEAYDKNDRNDQRPHERASRADFGRKCRFGRTLSALETRCPDLVPVGRWQQAVEDGRRFLTQWGGQAEVIGWTARDLFGLHQPPADAHPSYSRLSRCDETGLIWLLAGRPVVALTATTAAIRSPSGNVTIYRKLNKPALGPVGYSLAGFQ